MLSDVVSSVYFSRTIALCTRAYSTFPGPEKLIDVLETRPGTGRTILQCTMTGYNNLQDQASRFTSHVITTWANKFQKCCMFQIYRSIVWKTKPHIFNNADSDCNDKTFSEIIHLSTSSSDTFSETFLKLTNTEPDTFSDTLNQIHTEP